MANSVPSSQKSTVCSIYSEHDSSRFSRIISPLAVGQLLVSAGLLVVGLRWRQMVESQSHHPLLLQLSSLRRIQISLNTKVFSN